MSHVRQQVREAAAMLWAGLATTGDRVAVNRVLPLDKDLQPTLTVRTTGEQSSDISQAGTQSRVISLRAVVTCKGKTEAEVSDMLDEAAAEIEAALADEPDFGGLAQTYEYRGADIALDGSGERVTGTISLAFDVTVYTLRNDPETAL